MARVVLAPSKVLSRDGRFTVGLGGSQIRVMPPAFRQKIQMLGRVAATGPQKRFVAGAPATSQRGRQVEALEERPSGARDFGFPHREGRDRRFAEGGESSSHPQRVTPERERVPFS